METRKITIVSTKNQKKSVIMSAATTLAELKADLRQNNIDYTGMTFYEGTSKTELKTDESVLPHDVPYKGMTTNELVFMLTNNNKKIKSGATNGTMKRKEVYDKITELGLQNECKKKFGRNFTQCTTADLIYLVEKASKAASTPTTKVEKPAPVKEEKKEEVPVYEAKNPEVDTPIEFVDTKARAAITKLVDTLYWNDYLNTDEKEDILSILNSDTGNCNAEMEDSKTKSPYTDSDINDMFDFVI